LVTAHTHQAAFAVTRSLTRVFFCNAWTMSKKFSLLVAGDVEARESGAVAAVQDTAVACGAKAWLSGA
jgi:hypothetical protein